MTTVDKFFDELEKQYEQQLPFVVYSRPINSIIKCWRQKDRALNYTDTFKESGFVFAPFDLNEKAILFPKLNCNYNEIKVAQIELAKKATFNNGLNDFAKSSHETLVSRGIDEIEKGHLDKVVLSRNLKIELEQIKPLEIFKRLFNSYKNAMVYCWYHPNVGLWLGATPELLFKTEGQQLTTISLAGTQPFNEENKPVWTEKELEEQRIVTDYLVEQIKPFTSTTSISKVESIKAGRLWHLKTRLISRLNSDFSLEALIKSLHPTPAVCGFPKENAKAFILNNEGYNREFYTGFLGELNLMVSKARNNNTRNIENNAYASVKKCSNFYVNLRCMQVKGDTVYIYVGGGITKSSDPEKEYEETRNKAQTISTILR